MKIKEVYCNDMPKLLEQICSVEDYGLSRLLISMIKHNDKVMSIFIDQFYLQYPFTVGYLEKCAKDSYSDNNMESLKTEIDNLDMDSIIEINEVSTDDDLDYTIHDITIPYRIMHYTLNSFSGSRLHKLINGSIDSVVLTKFGEYNAIVDEEYTSAYPIVPGTKLYIMTNVNVLMLCGNSKISALYLDYTNVDFDALDINPEDYPQFFGELSEDGTMEPIRLGDVFIDKDDKSYNEDVILKYIKSFSDGPSVEINSYPYKWSEY